MPNIAKCGISDNQVNGAVEEQHLYHDTQNMASVLVKDNDGIHVVCMLLDNSCVLDFQMRCATLLSLQRHFA